ncbi:hypothetical protein SAMN02745163_02037 [Clostridium cavendishii DSM 21758]|uniref:Glycosyl transferase family 2 n=1 Tax=Clostridium cavendishii DSM 21758 TaxID=1121302 RepID=A0A1M6JI07_9CLOT|nr:hypothetical protein [Clostridium cavendishii]SHJ46316.1 hypothetical protein SAMN02745163_02037 [Clostridium cavendishii DSM 21758]
MKLAYIVTFYIDKNSDYYGRDLIMTKECFESLTFSENTEVFIYNQGNLTNGEISELLNPYDLKFYIIGSGKNVGIPKARYRLIKHILNTRPEIEYIAEIHLDMLFMANWHVPLIEYLSNTDEPMICPRIISNENSAFLIQDKNTPINFYGDLKTRLSKLSSFTENKVIFGFTNPVIHKVEALKNINYYDAGFLTGMQNFEDTSLLIGYRYYMGSKSNWRPKCNLNSCVFHKIAAQRFRILSSDDYNKNLSGLIRQYGAYGILEWYKMDGNEFYNNIYKSMILDKNAYDLED